SVSSDGSRSCSTSLFDKELSEYHHCNSQAPSPIGISNLCPQPPQSTSSSSDFIDSHIAILQTLHRTCTPRLTMPLDTRGVRYRRITLRSHCSSELKSWSFFSGGLKNGISRCF